MAGRTILVVDDFDSMRRFVCRAIERRGYRSLAAASAAEAQGILNSTPVDLLITDVNMPVMTGVELAASVAVDQPNLPILFMSGRAASHDVWRHGRRVMLLQKPFTVSILWDEIDKIFEP